MGQFPEEKIRVLRAEDKEEYARMRLESLRESPDSFGSTYEEVLRDKNFDAQIAKRVQPADDDFTLGAFEDGKLVSMATLERLSRRKTRHSADVLSVYTSPDYRGRGISRALLSKLIAMVKERTDIEQLKLKVVTENHGAYQLYRSLGFEVYGTDKHAFKKGDVYWDQYLMVLFL
ncbi:N-acetyltransferase family protein [Brevibacillus sp. NRS-1366]|uniref:GNAT family N-acetyltransferase n=1 Tax=Brevibacillus sp. NRS-1366 TaxID=3233899 RepID=UPI003D222156